MKHYPILFLIIIFVIVLIFVTGGAFYLYQKDNPQDTDYPVDLVYLWVDGNDPAWIKKKSFYQRKAGQLPQNATDIARFRQFDELKYSLRSVEKNLPWINHIFIVTDNQVPKWLDTNNPKITIIDHTQILPKEALPVFNSCALETRLPYIPGLSEHFLYANDDCYVRVPLEKSFFFNQEGNPRMYVKYKQRTYNTNLWLAQIQKAHQLIAQKYPLNFAITPSHNMEPYRKSYFLEAIDEYTEEFNKTTRSKFRQSSDINRVIIELRDRMLNRNEMYAKEDTSLLPPTCKTAFSLISNNFFALDYEMPCLFCLNDFEGKTENEIKITLRILNILYPTKSSFEK